MDSNPSIPFKFIYFLKNKIAAVLSVLLFSCVLFSCSNTAPSIVTTEAKVVFDFENEKSTPTQKLNLFLKMNSDVRRVETMSLNHNLTGLRWNISNPMISQVDNYFYAGYTNIQGVSQSGEKLPEGEYSITYIDGEGRQEMTIFTIQYNDEIMKMKPNQVVSYLKDKKPQVFVGVYSKEMNLIFYGQAKNDWNITKEYKDLKSSKLFSTYKDAQFYRVFFVIDNNVYIMPKIEKSGNNVPSSEEMEQAEKEQQAINER